MCGSGMGPIQGFTVGPGQADIPRQAFDPLLPKAALWTRRPCRAFTAPRLCRCSPERGSTILAQPAEMPTIGALRC
jgi:hypothetical protein